MVLIFMTKFRRFNNEQKTILLGLRSERKDLEIRAQEAYDNEKPKEAIDLVEQIRKLDERITKLEDEIKKDDEQNKGDNDSTSTSSTNGEQRSVSPFAPRATEGSKSKDSKEVRDFKRYIETRADIPGGSLKTDSGFVVIPEEIVTDILKLKEVEFNLDQYVTVKKVKTDQVNSQ